MEVVGAMKEIELNHKIVEMIIENNYVYKISIQEFVDKISELASKHSMLTVEVLSSIRTPAIVYEENFQAYIETVETDNGEIEEIFRLIRHTDDVGNIEFDVLMVQNIEWYRWNGYFLIKFIENIEIMISYDYNF